MWSICRCMWSLVLLVPRPGVCVTTLVLDGLLDVCLTACPSPGQERQMAPYQDSTYDPVTSHDLPKSRLPHHTHSAYPLDSVGGPARYLSGTRRQAPTRVSTPTPMVAAGGAGSDALLSRFRDLNSVFVLAKCNYLASRSERSRAR